MDPFISGILIGAASMLVPVRVLYSFARYQRHVIDAQRRARAEMWPAYMVGRARQAALRRPKAKKTGAAA